MCFHSFFFFPFLLPLHLFAGHFHYYYYSVCVSTLCGEAVHENLLKILVEGGTGRIRAVEKKILNSRGSEYMTSNDINAFKQYLWSLFQSYSYIPSGGGNGGPPARRLSESGYRAVISLVATADVMSRFFLAEGEITQRECLKRMDSERFREEVWEEMISAEERLRDCAGGVTEEAGNKEVELGELDVAISTDYDYHIMRPSLGQKTIGWNIFIAVLLLRLSNSLHLRIEDQILRGCQEALHPLARLLSVQGSCVASKVDGFASYLSQVERRPCIDKERPAATVMRFALEEHARDPAPRRSSASGSFFTSARIKTSLHDKASGSGVEVAAEVMQPTFVSPFERRRMRNVDALGRLEQFAGSVGGPSSATVGAGTAAHRLKPRCERMDVKNSIPSDEHPHQSSPPPRPKHSSMTVPAVSRPGCIGSARGRNVPIEVMKLHQRLTRGNKNRLEETGGDALFRGSRGSMKRSSLETTLEVWNSTHMKGNIPSADTGSEVYHARHDEEINKSDDERCRPAAHCSFLASSCSPSPNREQIRGAKRFWRPLEPICKMAPHAHWEKGHLCARRTFQPLSVLLMAHCGSGNKLALQREQSPAESQLVQRKHPNRNQLNYRPHNVGRGSSLGHRSHPQIEPSPERRGVNVLYNPLFPPREHHQWTVGGFKIETATK
ncbi:hypothetical protein TCSYLVIO_010064 [Trypanosoma cruzi]|nr:hypothetical protein TCSYLVIO_010064 [Trypanosoma cruzi]